MSSDSDMPGDESDDDNDYPIFKRVTTDSLKGDFNFILLVNREKSVTINIVYVINHLSIFRDCTWINSNRCSIP